jgi:site-specific DNA recombinase
MINAIAYVRVSTEEQRNSRLGLEAQRASIAATAKRQGLKVAGWYADEGIGGGVAPDKREGLLSALASLSKGAVLLVAKRDRLSRDDFVWAWLEREVSRKGARILSAAGEGTEDDKPESVLMRRMVDGFGEYERALIRSRTKAALRAKRARGEKTGGLVPFGYRVESDGKTLREEPQEQRALSRLLALKGQGLSLRAIGRQLAEEGLLPRTAKAWAPKVLASLIARAA